MKDFLKILSLVVFSIGTVHVSAQTSVLESTPKTMHLFIDVHQLKPGKIDYKAVAEAHAKDLAVQRKYNVDIQQYWIDKKEGLVFCLASAPDSLSIRKTHKEAHGLLPERIFPVTEGTEAALKGNRNLFLDIHYLGAGHVTAKDVAGAHQKDLAIQSKYGVNLINYWVNERDGIVMCLAEAKDSTALINTHREAHGLLPARVFKVKQGQY
jgi:hypothetical protein